MMRENKGITLIALIVIIAVIVIVSGIVIAASVSNNGIYKQSKEIQNLFEETAGSVDEKFDEYYDESYSEILGTVQKGETAKRGNRYYNDGDYTAVIPKGFTVSGIDGEDSIENGLVIYQTNGEEVTNWNTAKTTYNQWVWIPVDNPEDMYVYSEEGIALSGDTGVKTNYYSKSVQLGNENISRLLPGDTNGYSEPDIVVGNGSQYDAVNYSTVGFTSLEDMAKSLTKDYKEMIDSVKKYGGFYIGRYELTGTVENPTEKSGTVIKTNWYNFYKACKKFGQNNEKIETRIMWSNQWDEICKFISTKGDKVDLDDSRTYGNYRDSITPANVEGYGSAQITGYSNKWCTNNIYDLAGNCFEWVQGVAYGTRRNLRGCDVGYSGLEGKVSKRGCNFTTNTNVHWSTRPTMYIRAEQKSSLEKLKDAGTYTTKKTTVKDSSGKTVKIPSGFKIASDSATDVMEGVVIEDTNGNQFVWIPSYITGEQHEDHQIEYKRASFSWNVMTDTLNSSTNSYQINYNSSNGNYFTEALPEDEKISIKNNGGFYIGRYETGDSTIPTSSGNSLRTNSSSQTNAVVIKKGYAPYNFITRTNAIARTEEMDTQQGYSATTKICSSYAWDTAINFIQNKVENYGNSSPQGNYENVTKKYIDITGTNQTVASGTQAGVIPTGQTTPVCNIYDMGGNIWELTTEMYSNNGNPYSIRGGRFVDGYSNWPAGIRNTYNDGTYDNIGFRITLFL